MDPRRTTVVCALQSHAGVGWLFSYSRIPIVLFALAACDPTALPDTAPGSHVGDDVLADGGACTRPEEGCPCDAAETPVTCWGEPGPVVAGEGLTCHEGQRYCREGTWSGCETIRTFTLERPTTALISPSTACNPCNPDCAVARTYPTARDLRGGTSSGVEYDPSSGGITLTGGGTATTTLVDSDGDGVPDPADECRGPGFRRPCRGRAADDGLYHTLPFNGPTEHDPLQFRVQVRTADVYFLVDTTGSMGGEISNLRRGLTSGRYLAGCNGGIIGAIRCTIPDAWFGVGYFDDYPVSPYGGSRDRVYRNILDIDSSTGRAQSAVSSLRLHWGYDGPESQSQALWAVATGGSLGRFLPSRRCSGGRWGHPCFRDGAIPIVIMFTDNYFHNGPGGYRYSDGRLRTRARRWSESVRALNARGVKVITVHSGSGWWGPPPGLNDAYALANATGSISSSGRPYVFQISSSGSGLSSAVVSAVRDLANYSRMDVSARAVDDPSTGFDERRLVQTIRARSHPRGRCLGVVSGTVFRQCLPGTRVGFSAYFRNTVVRPTTRPQVFDFSIEILADRRYVLQRVPVRIVVPPEAPRFRPSGTFHRDFDSSAYCTSPPQRPDWGELTWRARTPAGTSIRFEIRTAARAAELGRTPPVVVTVPGTRPPVNVARLLASAGQPNFMPYLRVTAVLNASGDRTTAPVLTGFEQQYLCVENE